MTKKFKQFIFMFKSLMFCYLFIAFYEYKKVRTSYLLKPVFNQNELKLNFQSKKLILLFLEFKTLTKELLLYLYVKVKLKF